MRTVLSDFITDWLDANGEAEEQIIMIVEEALEYETQGDSGSDVLRSLSHKDPASAAAQLAAGFTPILERIIIALRENGELQPQRPAPSGAVEDYSDLETTSETT